MRRYLLAAVLALGLALPLEAAAGGSTQYEGTIAEGGIVKFGVRKSDGNRFVVRFRWRGFPVVCEAGPTTARGLFEFAMRVRDGAFRGRGEIPGFDGFAKVRGEFRQHRRRAEGTLRIEGDIPEIGDNCFGFGHWEASRV